MNYFQAFWTFLDFDGFDIFEDLVLTFGLEFNGRRLNEFERVAGGFSARSANKNGSYHEFGETPEISKAIAHAAEFVWVEIIVVALHDAAHGAAADGGVVGSLLVLWLAI